MHLFRYLLHCTTEQIKDIEQTCPVLNVVAIQRTSLHLDYPHDIAPLPIRDLIAEFVPKQFV
jgi:hypothetical protein